MTSSRAYATASLLTTGPSAGKILIAGGNSGSGALASTDLYDPVTNSFAPSANMNAGRFMATATVDSNTGKILIAGGIGSSGLSLASTEFYDPATDAFAPANQTASMNTGREQAVAIQLPEITPTSPISFVGVGPLADSRSQVSAVTLGVPSGIQSGDVMLAQLLIYDGAGTNVPSAPAGWSVIRHDAINSGGNQMTSWLYYKVAGSSEAASFTWNIGFQYAAGVMRAWRGASISSPIDQSSGSTGGGFNPISASAPSLTPATNNELQVYFYGAQAFKAPTIAEPSAITERLNEMSAVEGFTTAFGDLAAPAGGTASPTYVAMATSNIPNGAPPVMTAQAVLLVPLNAGPTPSPSTSTTPTSTPTMTIAPSPGGTPPLPTPVRTPTPIMTIRPTIIPSPGGTQPPTPATPLPTPRNTVPRFAASGALTDSAQPLTAVTVSLPPGVMSSDLLIAQVAVWDANGTNVPVAPAEWSPIRSDSVGSANKITSWLYYKVAGNSEPASYSWSIASQYAAGVMGAWREAWSSSPLDQSSGAGASGPSPVSDAAPSLTPPNNHELQVYFYGAQSVSAPSIIEPGAIAQQTDAKSSKEGFTLAFGDLAAPSQGIASPTYAASASIASGSPVLTAQAVLLRPGP